MKKDIKIKRAALYDPFLDTLGGGEKHILSILKVLEDEGYEINIFWDKNLQKQIENRFSLRFNQNFKFLPNIFKSKNTLWTLKTLRTFDYFFYVTDGSYFFSSAKKNLVFSMVPDHKLYNLNFINRLKLKNYRFIANSQFTQNHLGKLGIKSEVIYPYIEKEFMKTASLNGKKENIILSVGRFYGHLHAKQHSKIINLFNKLHYSIPQFKNFKLILAGGVKQEDKDYLNNLQQQIRQNSNIVISTNIGYSELLELYQKSKIYLHFTGFGIDEKIHPEQVEHLGITVLEAMASGCLTFAYNSGGVKEIINDEINGYLFKTESELNAKLDAVLKDPEKQIQVRKNALQTINNKFGYDNFKNRIREVII